MLSADLDRHGEPERENGWRDGVLPELCFRQCQALGPVILWCYPRVGVLLKEHLQGVHLA